MSFKTGEIFRCILVAFQDRCYTVRYVLFVFKDRCNTFRCILVVFHDRCYTVQHILAVFQHITGNVYLWFFNIGVILSAVYWGSFKQVLYCQVCIGDP